MNFSISKTFASGRTEKRIFEILKELGLPSGKVALKTSVWFLFFLFLFHSLHLRMMKLIQRILHLKNFVIYTIRFVLVLILLSYSTSYQVEKII